MPDTVKTSKAEVEEYLKQKHGDVLSVSRDRRSGGGFHHPCVHHKRGCQWAVRVHSVNSTQYAIYTTTAHHSRHPNPNDLPARGLPLNVKMACERVMRDSPQATPSQLQNILVKIVDTFLPVMDLSL